MPETLHMKKALLISLGVGLCISCSDSTPHPQPEWRQLFNGKDLNNWIIKIKDAPLNENTGNVFGVEDGKLVVNYEQYEEFRERYGHIFYNEEFSSYLLGIEYRFVGEQVKGGPGWAYRNSGVMLHSQSPESMLLDQDFPVSLEAQFLGGNGTEERPTGNLCTPGTNVILKGELFTPHCVNSTSKTYHGDTWVRAEVLVFKDSIIHHIIEGNTVLTYTQPQYDGNDPWVQKLNLPAGAAISKGYIALQSESHPVEFRKVEIIDLSRYENNPAKLSELLEKIRKKK